MAKRSAAMRFGTYDSLVRVRLRPILAPNAELPADSHTAYIVTLKTPLSLRGEVG
jgi:hypothetical protein